MSFSLCRAFYRVGVVEHIEINTLGKWLACLVGAFPSVVRVVVVRRFKNQLAPTIEYLDGIWSVFDTSNEEEVVVAVLFAGCQHRAHLKAIFLAESHRVYSNPCTAIAVVEYEGYDFAGTQTLRALAIAAVTKIA